MTTSRYADKNYDARFLMHDATKSPITDALNRIYANRKPKLNKNEEEKHKPLNPK